MFLNIQPANKTPLYIQIYQTIKEKIHNNDLQINEQLPSKRQLATANNVSENTIMNAYDQLLIEGYIYSIERKGYYVSEVDLQYDLPYLDEEITLSTEPTVKYDFTRSTPDENIFPFSVFSKLYRHLFKNPDPNILSETDGQGLYALRVSLQHYLSLTRGVPCTTEQIILGPSTEYLLSILLTLLKKNTTIGIEDPGYHGFQELFKRLNVSTIPIPVKKTGADINVLSKSSVDLMLVTSNHQFPTGNIMPLQQRQELLQWANKGENHYIIENDYDSEFKYSGLPIPSLKYLDQDERVIHLGSFTRVLAPSLRLSYMVLPSQLLEKYKETFSKQSSTLSTMEQMIIHKFIEEGHFSTHLNRSRTFYKKKRDQIIKAIKKQDKKAQIYGEKAGLHLLVQPSIVFNGQEFKKLAAEKQIKLNLLSDYSFQPEEKDENILFLSFSNIPVEQIEEIIQRIFELILLAAENDTM